MARKGILTTDVKSSESRKAPADNRMMPRGAVGALQSSLTKLQESAVQEIDAGLVDDAGYEDRLGRDSAAEQQLVESLRTYGQQVPVLLRPHPETQGRYEIVYGRRRLRALRELGLPVKAMVRQLDDHALVMAQGQENTSRQDLSFIEKASFAAQLNESGYDKDTIAAALSTDKPMLSRMLTVGQAFPLPFLRQIGSAPGIGRDRWLALVKLFEDDAARSRGMRVTARPEFAPLNSDDRFEAVYKAAAAKPAPTAPAAPAPRRTLRGPDGKALADVRRTNRGLTLTVSDRNAADFGEWLDRNADRLIQDLHDRYKNERSED